jgi:hypothetical protein
MVVGTPVIVLMTVVVMIMGVMDGTTSEELVGEGMLVELSDVEVGKKEENVVEISVLDSKLRLGERVLLVLSEVVSVSEIEVPNDGVERTSDVEELKTRLVGDEDETSDSLELELNA